MTTILFCDLLSFLSGGSTAYMRFKLHNLLAALPQNRGIMKCRPIIKQSNHNTYEFTSEACRELSWFVHLGVRTTDSGGLGGGPPNRRRRSRRIFTTETLSDLLRFNKITIICVIVGWENSEDFARENFKNYISKHWVESWVYVHFDHCFYGQRYVTLLKQ